MLLALLLAYPASARQPPALPFSPYGAVMANGARVPDGMVVSAWCGAVSPRLTSTVVASGESWYFNLDIPGDDPETPGVKEACSSDEIVSCKIGGSWAKEKAQWVSGSSARVDLTGFSGTTVPNRTWLPLVYRPGATRRVNAPYFAAAVRYSEMAVFWFGKVTPTENYADVRVGYDSQQLVLNVASFDRRLWYDTTPSPGDLNAWDAATLYLSLDGGAGAALGPKAYRLVGQLNWWEEPRTQWQTAFRYDGTAWASVNLPSTTSSGWRGDAPNSDEDDRGWNLSFIVPFSSLGLPSPPAPGTVWRMAVVLHDRDDAAGTPIPDKTWPENVAADRPATWGQLSFGQPTYEPPAATAEGSVTIRHRLNGSAVPDAAVGGAAVCGAGTDFWTQWGETNEAFYSPAR